MAHVVRLVRGARRGVRGSGGQSPREPCRMCTDFIGTTLRYAVVRSVRSTECMHYAVSRTLRGLRLTASQGGER